VLQQSRRWMASAIALFALVAFGGDARMDMASAANRPAATPIRVETVPAFDELPRASVGSRAWIRAEVADAAATPPPPIEVAVAKVEPEPEPVAAPAAAVAPVRVVPPAPAVPVQATCAANQFCYPRVGIAGTIVPYTDCTGKTDVGTAIRSITCVSPTYLAAHAYTQFGRITGWRAGDVVFAYGTRYVIFDAFTQQSCAPPARAIAPLSLQTSLTPANCGPILVVQGRPG
jgi:hypothetical protein